MRAVDTNLLVRLIVRDDAAQVAAAEAFVAGGAWVSHLVLAETIWVLDAVHERTAAQLAAAIEMLLNHEQLSIQDAEVVSQALEQFRSGPCSASRIAWFSKSPARRAICRSARSTARWGSSRGRSVYEAADQASIPPSRVTASAMPASSAKPQARRLLAPLRQTNAGSAPAVISPSRSRNSPSGIFTAPGK